ncbi:MAG: DNA recombination protein RmuC [Bacilli bacterium]
MEPLIIVFLALALTLQIGILILLLIFRKKDRNLPVGEVDLSEFYRLVGGIETEIKNVKEAISDQMKIALKEEMLILAKQSSETNEQNNAKLERFQKGITESLEKKLNELTKKVDEALANINKRVDEQIKTGFTTTSEQMEKVAMGLGKLEEAQKQIESLKGEVTNLSGILSNNQQRGRFGEFQLGAILHNVFGDTRELYSLQYEIKVPNSPEKIRPDAVVFLPEPNKLVCIDSKFPYQEYELLYTREDESKERKTSFRNDIKKHIKAIREKYIIKGVTASQAVMFIPSDGIYTYINLEYPELMEEAMQNQVVITSPATLQPMLVSIYGLIINYQRAENIEKISKAISTLALDFKKFIEAWDKILKNIQTTHRASEEFDSRVRIINRKFDRIQSSEIVMKDQEEKIK